MAEQQYKHMHTDVILTTVELGYRTVEQLAEDVAREEMNEIFPEIPASEQEALIIMRSKRRSSN
jgi:hypothetical protein